MYSVTVKYNNDAASEKFFNVSEVRVSEEIEVMASHLMIEHKEGIFNVTHRCELNKISRIEIVFPR